MCNLAESSKNAKGKKSVLGGGATCTIQYSTAAILMALWS